MQPRNGLGKVAMLFSLSLLMTSCATTRNSDGSYSYGSYTSRLPQTIATSEKTIVVDPRMHVWGAYDANGQLVKAGLASAGADYCRDIGRPCRTSVGQFRIQSLGGPDCVSRTFPLYRGGSPMPYCMFFHNGEALHGVPPHEVGEGNFSHGCVRMHVGDAEWIRYEFAGVGTKVIVKSY